MFETDLSEKEISIARKEFRGLPFECKYNTRHVRIIPHLVLHPQKENFKLNHFRTKRKFKYVNEDTCTIRPLPIFHCDICSPRIARWKIIWEMEICNSKRIQIVFRKKH